MRSCNIITEAGEKAGKKHKEHIGVEHVGNGGCLIGAHGTAAFDKCSHGAANTGAPS